MTDTHRSGNQNDDHRSDATTREHPPRRQPPRSISRSNRRGELVASAAIAGLGVLAGPTIGSAVTTTAAFLFVAACAGLLVLAGCSNVFRLVNEIPGSVTTSVLAAVAGGSLLIVSLLAAGIGTAGTGVALACTALTGADAIGSRRQRRVIDAPKRDHNDRVRATPGVGERPRTDADDFPWE